MAQSDCFLKIEGIEGESQDARYKGAIEVESWSWGAHQKGAHTAGGGGGAGKVRLQTFHLILLTSKASPKLMLACALGDHIPRAVLTCRKAGAVQQEYLTITMSDLLVCSFGMGLPRGPSTADQISLGFSKIEFAYREQLPDGSLAGTIRGGWDQKANVAV